MYLLRANGLLYFRKGAIQRPIWLTLKLKWTYKYWTSKTAELIHNFWIANTPDYSVFASKFINVLQCSWSLRKSRGVAFATTYILTTGRSAGWVGWDGVANGSQAQLKSIMVNIYFSLIDTSKINPIVIRDIDGMLHIGFNTFNY